jgi:hypothetical protein
MANIRYKIDPATKEIGGGFRDFVHYPIKLAYNGIKARIDFDKAAIDVSQVLGQAYVALSRLRSLEGLILLSPLRMNGISNDQDVMDYSLNKASEELLKTPTF